MEYDPKTANIEIDRIKGEIQSLKNEEKSFGDLNATLNSLQQKYEKFKKEKRIAELILAEKLQLTKQKIQEASYDKDRLEKEYLSVSYALKNSKITFEEVDEMLVERHQELSSLNRTAIESEEMLRQKESELSKCTKENERLAAERKEFKTSFHKHEEELKAQLKMDKELEDEEMNLDLNDVKTRAEISIMEKELEELSSKETTLHQRLKSNELEQERLDKFGKEMDKEIMDIKDLNEKIHSQKEDFIFKLKQESQKNIKLESNLKQYQIVATATEETLSVLLDKLGQVDARVNHKSAEHSYNQTMIEEDKKDLERMIKGCEAQNEYLVQMFNCHKEIAEKLENQSRNNKIGDLKNELLKIME